MWLCLLLGDCCPVPAVLTPWDSSDVAVLLSGHGCPVLAVTIPWDSSDLTIPGLWYGSDPAVLHPLDSSHLSGPAIPLFRGGGTDPAAPIPWESSVLAVTVPWSSAGLAVPAPGGGSDPAVPVPRTRSRGCGRLSAGSEPCTAAWPAWRSRTGSSWGSLRRASPRKVGLGWVWVS